MQKEEVFVRSETAGREGLLVDRSEGGGHDGVDASGVEVVEQPSHVVGLRGRAAHGHHLGGSGIAPPWVEAQYGSPVGHETLDLGHSVAGWVAGWFDR